MKITLNGLCDNAIRDFGVSMPLSSAERLLLQSYMPLVLAVTKTATDALCKVEAIRFKTNNYGDKNPPPYLPLAIYLRQGNTKQTVMLEMQDDGSRVIAGIRDLGEHARLIRIPPTISSAYQFAAKYRAVMRSDWRNTNRLQAMLHLFKQGIYFSTPEARQRMCQYHMMRRSLFSDNARIKKGTIVRWLHPQTDAEQTVTFGGFGRRECPNTRDMLNCFWLITSTNREVVFYENPEAGEPVPLHVFEQMDKHTGEVEDIPITPEVTELPMAHLPLQINTRVRFRYRGGEKGDWHKGTLTKLTASGMARIDDDNGKKLTVGLTSTQIQRLMPVRTTD